MRNTLIDSRCSSFISKRILEVHVGVMEQIRKKVNVAYFSSITANILFFCLGTTMTWISPLSSKIENSTAIFDEPVPENFVSLVSSLPQYGATISAYVYTYVADKFGRKIAILSLGMPYLLPYLLMALRNTVKIYLCARFVLGLAMGGTFSVIPIYAGEISNKSTRAAFNSIGGVTLAAGALFSYVIGPMLSLNNFNLILSFFPALFLLLFFVFGEETPHYYSFKNQEVLAREALTKLGVLSGSIDWEVEQIRNIIKEQSEYTLLSFIKKTAFIKNFLLTLGLLIIQQVTGINAVLMLNESIFELTGSNFDSSVCYVIVGIVQFFSSLFVFIYEQRFGRKTLLITSALTMSVLLTILGVHCMLIDYGLIHYHLKTLPLIVLNLFLLSYFIGIGPIPFVILSEILPWRVKSLSVSLVTTIYFITVLLMVNYFECYVKILGLGICFLSLAIFCLITIAFVNFYLEETKDKTFEEIQNMYKTQNIS